MIDIYRIGPTGGGTYIARTEGDLTSAPRMIAKAVENGRVTMKPMLASSMDLSKVKYPVIGQLKYDGIRCIVKDGVALSRKLLPIANREIQRVIGCPAFEGCDGELIVGEATAKDCFRKTSSFVMSADKEGEPWTYVVFDVWNQPKMTTTERLASIERAAIPQWLGTQVVAAQWLRLADEAALEAFEGKALASGHEGVIIRRPDALYKFGRATATGGELMKVKRFHDSEAVVVGMVELQHNGNEAQRDELGRTKRSSAKAGKTGRGTMGKLLVRQLADTKGVAAGTEFSIGTGFSASERDTWWVADGGIGKIVKYRYVPVGVKDKPRFPSYVGVRHEADL